MNNQSFGNHRLRWAAVLSSVIILSIPASSAVGQICSHSYDFFLDANPSNYLFGTHAPQEADMASAIAARMGVPVSVVTGPFANENTAAPPVLGNSGQPPYYAYGPGPGGAIPGGAIYNLNLQQPIVTGIVRAQLRFLATIPRDDGNYDEFILRVYTAAATFHDVLIAQNFYAFLPDNGGVCGYTDAGWDFFQVSGPRPIPGPTLTSAASRKVHGTSGTFDLNLPLSGTRGVECRSGGANGNYTVVFTFSENLTSVNSAAVTPCGRVSSAGLGPDPNQCTVNLTGVCNAQYITVTLAGVHGINGGTTAAASATMGMLLGDTTANGVVNSSDIAQVQSQSGQTLTINNFREDVTVNGVINSSDIVAVQSQSGTALPTPP